VSTIAHPRVVIADDSSFMRRLLSSALSDTGFEVVGVAADGYQALALCDAVKPDVLSLDLAMPGATGLDVLRRLRDSGSRIPVVVVSAFSPAFGSHAVDALSEGAFDLVAKPAPGESIHGFLASLREKIGLAAHSRAPVAQLPPTNGHRPSSRAATRRAVVIATSTGGPKALAQVLPKLPSPLGAGALIVQHMPPGFTKSLAQRLDRASALSVVEAAGGESVESRTALLAPGGHHLRLDRSGTARLAADDPIGGLRPRADLTIADTTAVFGERVLLVVLTGMGKDGLEGAREVRRRGGRVIAEADSTCTVYGMPRAVVEAGLADLVLPLHELPEAIAAEAGR
jgi:two-component system chemotaxis response regulator CheB